LAAQAIPLLKEALSANPNVAEAHGELGYAYRYGGMLPESLAECESALERRGTIRPRFRNEPRPQRRNSGRHCRRRQRHPHTRHLPHGQG
jgi:tetratricopeptide (TPR) repeat protein